MKLVLWESKVCNAEKFKLKIKTTENNFEKLEKFIKANHTFKVPQIIALPIIKSSNNFLSWLKENVSCQ